MVKSIKILILVCGAILLIQLTLSSTTAAGSTYYISPTGNDSNSGTAETAPWATFNRAWQSLYPGDTLILLDGIYNQSLNPNKRNGEAGNPITIKAKNDGKAIIDGQNVRVPVKLGDTWPGPIGQYFVIEGIVARNSNGAVFQIEKTRHNILRRVSGYNANTNTNHHVFSVNDSSYNLIEDCVAAGTGRKMIMLFSGTGQEGYNVVRRCFAYWQDWQGLDTCHGHWPWGDGIQVYNSTGNTIENSIAAGSVSGWQMSIQNQSGGSFTIRDNKILGSISVNAGLNWDGSLRNWGPGQVDPISSPNPSCPLWSSRWNGQRTGMIFYGSHMENNLLQDVFFSNNAGVGLSMATAGANTTGQLNRATIINNGLNAPEGIGVNVSPDFHGFTVTNSKIGGTAHNGEGARLTNRYVDGVLTNQPLWPWPMQDRIQAELGLDITGKMQAIIAGSGSGPTPTPGPTPTASPTPTPSPTPRPNFNLQANPVSRVISPGQSTTVDIDIQALFGFAETVRVTLTDPSPQLNLSTTSFNVNSPYNPVTVTLTDLNDPSFSSSAVYEIPVTANGGGITKNTSVRVVVNGTWVFLPIISK